MLSSHALAPWRATLLLLTALAVGLAILVGGQHAGRRVSTDVLELLPRDQLDSTIKLARQTVSGRFGRTLLFSLADRAHPDKAPTQAAAAMGAELAANPAFNGVFIGLTNEGKDRLQQWFFDRRLALPRRSADAGPQPADRGGLMGAARNAFAPVIDPDLALERLSAVVSDSGADQMDAFLMGRTGQYTRFADGRIHQPQDITELQVMVRAVVDGHSARAATSTLADLQRAAATATRMARSIATTAGAPGRSFVATAADHPEAAVLPPEVLRPSSTDAFDESVRVADVRHAIQAAASAGGTAAGMIGRALTQLVAVTSGGLARATVASEAMGGFTIAVDDGTSHFIDLGRSADRLCLSEAVRITVAQALAGRGRTELEPGEYTVVLGPEATAELLEFLPGFGFSGELAAAGVGLWARSAGRQVLSELVDVADDALADVGLPIGFDIEGVGKQRVPMFAAGVVGSPVSDLRTATQMGHRSTGQAHIAREEVPETRAANIVMRPGASTEAELIAGVRRGVYLQRFWYTRMVDRNAGTITGVTRDACFEIVDGRLGRPLAGMRFTQSVLALLATVDGVADTTRSIPMMNVFNGAATAPAIRAHGFRLGAAPATKTPEQRAGTTA